MGLLRSKALRTAEKETRRPFVLAAILIGMFMAAIEATIVATAMPRIVSDLGGFSIFSWVFSIYLLMQAITIPIYGKLADLFGRKPVFTFGILLFLTGSTLCGFSTSMEMLIIGRLIQGVGAGAVQPISMTIIGDIYTMEERAKIQGLLSSVWGFSAIIGPALGGVFSDYLHWVWVFWMNIPLGIIACIGIILFLHEDVEKKRQKIDYLGSSLLLIAVSSLMLILTQAGTNWPWRSIEVISLLGLFLLAFIFFLMQEQRAANPVMPLSIWKNRIIGVSNLASLTTGAVMIGVSSYLPTYVQGVMNKSSTLAGFTLATMSIGWPIASTFAARLILTLGFRITAVMGGIFLIFGSIFFITLTYINTPLWAAVGSFFIGVGMGLSTTTFIVTIQNSVDWKMRGVATASNMFMRILGNTIGVSLLGGILNLQMNSYLKTIGKENNVVIDLNAMNILLDPEKRAQLPIHVVHTLQAGLSSSLHTVYWVVIILAIISFIFITLLPKQGKANGKVQDVN